MEVNEEEEGMVVIGGGAAGHTAVETLRSAQVVRQIVHIDNDNHRDRTDTNGQTTLEQMI